MRCISSGLAAATAIAVLVRNSFAADSLLDDVLKQRETAARNLIESSGQVDEEGVSTGTGSDSLAVRVAEIQGMDETELKLALRSLYSISKDAQKKLIYPAGCLEAMQEVLNTLGSVDEDQRDVGQFMNRFAFLVGQTFDKYNDLFTLKVTLSDPFISREDYKKEVKKAPLLVAQWTAANELLVAFLTLAANDLRDKWDQRADTERRLRAILGFIDELAEVYKAHQRLFRTGYALAQLRYMEHEDRQADLTDLMVDPRQKQATIEYEDALENLRERTHQARKAAASSVQDGILASEYLTLLPFPPDKQRESDDMPEDEMEA